MMGHLWTIARLPVLRDLVRYDRQRLPADVLAGLALAALVIPQALGYSKIAGAPVVSGLYAALLPMAIFAVFGSSRHLVVGADSATAAILAATLAGLAVPGTGDYLAFCSLVALMAACLLLLARFARLGFLSDFLSRTVLVGFLTGVGIQVALLQLDAMLGLPRQGSSPAAHLLGTLRHLAATDGLSLALSLGVAAVILGCRRCSRWLPGPLLAVVASIILSRVLHFAELGVATLGPIPAGLPFFGWPPVSIDLEHLKRLFGPAFSIFVVILAQSAATARAFASRHDEPFDENRDLLGLGLANAAAGLTGSFVVNGSPTASELVEQAGSRSQLSMLVCSGTVVLVLLFLTGPLADLPLAALATLVFMISIHLIDLQGMRRIYRERPWEFWVALITAGTVITVGVEQGILLALFLSLAIHTRHGYRPKNMLIVLDDTGHWRMVPLTSRRQTAAGLLYYRFTHGLYYANAEVLTREVSWLAAGAQPALVWFAIDAAAIDDIDFTAAAALRGLCERLRARNIRLVFSDLLPEVRDQLERSGLIELLGRDAFFDSGVELLKAYRQQMATGGKA